MIQPNTIIREDCIKILEANPDPIADLIFADPPFNIGYKYDVYEDRKAGLRSGMSTQPRSASLPARAGCICGTG
jgi:DNA modification methylase